MIRQDLVGGGLQTIWFHGSCVEWAARAERQRVKTERERTKGGTPFSARGKDKGTISQKVLEGKDNYVVIRMSVGYLTQWGSSWPRERVCGRGGIRKNCGNPWKNKRAHGSASPTRCSFRAAR